MFNILQVLGAIWIAFMLDNMRIRSRRARGLITVAAVATIVIAAWIGLTVWLYKNPLDPLNPPLYDWKDGPFGGFFVLNLVFGVVMVAVCAFFPSPPLSTVLPSITAHTPYIISFL